MYSMPNRSHLYGLCQHSNLLEKLWDLEVVHNNIKQDEHVLFMVNILENVQKITSEPV